ncbi:MAG: WbuC family cupin fold metalloprotein [Nitrospirota bacterium]
MSDAEYPATAHIRRIDQALLDRVTAEAARHPRLRMNHNFHQHEEPVQRLLNAVEPGSYVRPHRHVDPPKWEMFVCLRGRGAAVVFDDDGRIVDIHRLDPGRGTYGVEIAAGVWHSIISLAPGSVFLEVKEGPYKPKHTGVFAPWSPAPDDPGVAEFLAALERAASVQ